MKSVSIFSGRLTSPAKCIRALENIVYYPELPPFEYLKKISMELRLQAKLIIRQVPMGEYGLVFSFVYKYGVEVGFGPLTAFKNTPIFQRFYGHVGRQVPERYVFPFSYQVMRAFAVEQSFVQDSKNADYVTGFTFFNEEDGTGATFIITLPNRGQSFSFC